MELLSQKNAKTQKNINITHAIIFFNSWLNL
jgi:hypothetical protein